MKMRAFLAALPHTLPICVAWLFLGMSYGFYMPSKGFSFVYPMLMSFFIFAGSMEFVTVGLLLGPFNPLSAFLLTLMVNARHLFYGISMLDKYRDCGLKKGYLIFGLCDESFSINCSVAPPPDVDRGWFMFFVTLLNHIYWVLGSTLGGLVGYAVRFDAKGIEFVMTALFVVIFLNQWEKEKQHASAVIGLAAPLVCLRIFGAGSFLIPSMVCILAALLLLRRPIEAKESEAVR